MGKRSLTGGTEPLLIWQPHCHRNSSVRLEILRHHLSMVLPFFRYVAYLRLGIQLAGAFYNPFKSV